MKKFLFSDVLLNSTMSCDKHIFVTDQLYEQQHWLNYISLMNRPIKRSKTTCTWQRRPYSSHMARVNLLRIICSAENVRQATVRGADHSQTGQSVLTGTLSTLRVGPYRSACVQTVCVPTDITDSLSAGPTLWELRFKARHKIHIQTHTHKKGLLAVSS